MLNDDEKTAIGRQLFQNIHDYSGFTFDGPATILVGVDHTGLFQWALVNKHPSDFELTYVVGSYPGDDTRNGAFSFGSVRLTAERLEELRQRHMDFSVTDVWKTIVIEAAEAFVYALADQSAHLSTEVGFDVHAFVRENPEADPEVVCAALDAQLHLRVADRISTTLMDPDEDMSDEDRDRFTRLVDISRRLISGTGTPEDLQEAIQYMQSEGR